MTIMRTLSVSFFFILCGTVYADVAHGVLERYKKNNIFICVGIYSCVSLARALNAGFMEIHGIEKDEVLVKHAKIIFPHDINPNRFQVTNYHIHYGGIEILESLLMRINKPTTIFLGSHFPERECTVINDLLDELDVIKNHPIKNHTILIDYINYVDTPEFGNISLREIQDKIRDINFSYIFSFAEGGRLEKEQHAILVAYIP